MKMMTCTRPFEFKHSDGRHDEVLLDERIAADHELARLYPNNFEEFTLRAELAVRSARIADLNEQATRPASREPLSRAGIAEREELRFWAGVTQELTRDTRTSEQRAEERVFDEGLAQIERLDAARLAEETDQFRSMWAGRLPLER